MRNTAHRSRAVVVLLAVVGLLCSLLVVPIALAAPARAALPPTCDESDCPPEPEPTVHTYTSTLTVSPPATGRITATSPGSSATIDCGVGGAGTCSVTDTVETASPRRPVSGWPVYTLRAVGGPAGYAFRWDSGCATDGDCVIGNKTPDTEAGGHWADVTPPAVALLDVPAGAADDTPLRVTATDNDRVSSYHWRICAGDGSSCDREQLGSRDVFTLGPRTAGLWTVLVRAGDPAGNWSPWAQASTRYDTAGPSLTVATPQSGATVGLRFTTTFTVGDDNGPVEVTCAVDGGAARPCTSPHTVEVGSFGAHVVHLVATDAAGNRTAVERSVRVVATELHPETDFPPTYGDTWFVVYGAVASDATGRFDVRDHATGALLCQGPAGSGGCRVSGTALRPGTHTIDVVYGGDARNPSVRGSFTTQVRPPAPAGPFRVIAPATRYGVAHPLTATSLPASATGVVTFTTNGRVLCRGTVRAGTARCAAGATALPVGTHTVRADLVDAVLPRQQASTRLAVSRGVARVTARAGAARVNKRVTLTARIVAPGASGRVVFTTGARTLCTATVRAGVARCTAAPSRKPVRVSVRARYTGDPRWSAATAATSYRVR